MTVQVPGLRPIAFGVCLVAVTLVGGGCSLLGDRSGADDGSSADVVDTTVSSLPSDTLAGGDSTVVIASGDSVADSSVVADPVAGVAGAAAASAPAATQLAPTIEDRLQRLLDSQEATNRRLDQLAGRLPAGDSATAQNGSDAVLGAAGSQVRSFGVGIAWSIVVLILFNLTIRSFVWVLDQLAERNASRRLFYKRLVPIVRIVLWVFAAYLIIRVIFRVDAQGIVAAAAAIGVAVGFAAQDLLKNLFGGLILVFDQPFQVGDKISIGGTYGEVVSIGLRSTRIVTPDDNLVSVPNSQVVDQQVANANAGELNCQVVTDLYLPGWADEAEAKRIAFQAAASSKYVYQKKPIVTLVSDVFKETFLTRVRVKAYVLDPRLEFQFQSDVTERARAGFREAGLLRPEHMRIGLVTQAGVSMPRVEEDSHGVE